MSAPRSRRRVRVAGASLAGIAAVALVLAPGAGAATKYKTDATLKTMSTLPTFKPERLKVVTKTDQASSSKLFIASKRNVPNWQTGPMLFDGNGKLLWYKPAVGTDMVTDFRTQVYDGKPVLTWWQGDNFRGYGEGKGVIYDQSYKQIASVKAGNGYKMDLHEFNLTPQGTALLIAYKVLKGDTTSRRGGQKSGLIHDNVVQEVDVKTGKVLMQWDGAKDIKLTESYNTIPEDKTIPYDYMHMNSVNLTQDGNVVVSARATHAYYKINRKTGKLMWRMGGRASDFKMGKGSRTLFQHDVHQLSPTMWSAFDNHADAPAKGLESRGVLLKVDEKHMTVALAKEFTHPTPILGASQGNMQTLPNGHEFIGWGGDNQNFTEFDAAGEVVFDAKLLSPLTDSYRAYRGDWSGTPTDSPLVDVTKSGADKATVRMSWNGATEIATWRVLAGPADGQLTEIGTLPWKDLESGATFSTTQPKYQVEALDGAGTVLGRSAVVDSHS